MVYRIVSNDYNISDIKFPTSKNKNIVNKQSKFEKHTNKKMPLPKFKQMIFTKKNTKQTPNIYLAAVEKNRMIIGYHL